MNPKHIIVAALAALTPFAAPAAALAQEAPPFEAARGYTEIRIAPPPGGRVYVYEGHRLLGRFEREGTMLVATGRSYRVVAMKGDEQVWSGDVTASGPPLELRWDEYQRRRTPQGEERAPRWEQAPPAYPTMSTGELRSLLGELDATRDDLDRLDAVAQAASRRWFSVPQASWILGRFRSDAFRLAALDRMRGRIVDREDAGALVQRFRSPSAQQMAAALIGW